MTIYTQKALLFLFLLLFFFFYLQLLCIHLHNTSTPSQPEVAQHLEGHTRDKAPEGQRGRRKAVSTPAALHVDKHSVPLCDDGP